MLNLEVPFEDALKFNLAMDECIRKVNSDKRSTTKGKRAAIGLAIHLRQGRIAVYEAVLPRASEMHYQEEDEEKLRTL